jgi:hypothetical protein
LEKHLQSSRLLPRKRLFAVDPSNSLLGDKAMDEAFGEESGLTAGARMTNLIRFAR